MSATVFFDQMLPNENGADRMWLKVIEHDGQILLSNVKVSDGMSEDYTVLTKDMLAELREALENAWPHGAEDVLPPRK